MKDEKTFTTLAAPKNSRRMEANYEGKENNNKKGKKDYVTFYLNSDCNYTAISTLLVDNIFIEKQC